MASCIRSLLHPENDTEACWRRAEVGARFAVQALSAMKHTPRSIDNLAIAVNNLARAMGAR